MEKSYRSLFESRQPLCGQHIKRLVDTNGIRVVLDDGTWGLVRASSNKPVLVIVAESPVSEKRMRDMLTDIDRRLKELGGVGAYDQGL